MALTTVPVELANLDGAVTVNESSADADFRVESNGNANMLFVNGGSDSVLVGHNTDISVAGESHELQVYDTNFSTISAATFRNGSDGASISLGHSRSGTIGTQTVLQDGDTMGAINFLGSDGTDMASYGARIYVEVDGTPGSNDMPGRIKFATTADGANGSTDRMIIDSSGRLLHGTDTVPTGVLLGNQLVSSSATGAEIIAFRADTATEAGDKTGAFLLGNSDSSGTEDHFVGMYGKAFDAFGRQHLHFVSGRDNYENDTPQMTLTSNGGIQLGTTSNNYTHDAGMRIVTSEVGSNYLDAALSLHGSGGDFYAQNWTGPSDTGFGLLTVFSGTTDYMIYAYRASSSNTSILQLYQNGDVQVHGALSKGSGSFRITHPLPSKKDTHELVHSFIEGPQADLIYRGAVDLVGGSATVNLDTAGRMTEGTFVLLNTNTQCFTSNESGWTPVKGSVSGNILTITAQDNTCTDTISWMVVGERHDQHMKDTDWTDSDGRPITEPLKRD